MKHRALAVAAVVITGVVTAPVASATVAGTNAHALPPHSQRPVCGPPAAKKANCHAHVVTYPDSATPLATSSYQSGWAPPDLVSAYNLPTAAAGSTPTVAIVDAFDNPNAETDLGAYRSRFGLAPCTTANGCFRKVNQSGGASYPSGNTDWGAEIDLDIDMVSAACPNCHILLVETNDNTFNNLFAGVDRAVLMGANFISNSYGGTEFSSEASFDTHFNHSGIGITVSSGDDGYGVEYPASSPDVTAVGGTSLTKNASTSRGWSETTWSGAGSGCSVYEPKPSWQHDSGCSRRTVADVSAIANPNTGVAVFDSYGSSGGLNWYVYGGTSVAAPFVAAVWALGPAVVPPSAGIPYLHTGSWNDVTSGANSSRCRSGYLCQATGGYDGPTGLGTPVGATGFGGTAGTGGGGGGGGNTAPNASFTWTCPTLTCSFTNTSTDNENNITGYSWNFGDGSAASTQTNPSHTYSGTGPWSVTLTATDAGGLSNSNTQTVTATPPPGNITLTGSGSKTKGSNTANLSWTGASGNVDVYRGATKLAPNVTGTTYRDNTGTKGAASFTYKVCPVNSLSNCSNTVTINF